MLADYQGKILFSFKEFPLASIHPYAELAAEAALAANAQGKFWPYHDTLYANQTSLGRAALDSYATSVGLDLATFDAALDAGTYKAAVAADESQGVSVGVNATPTFYINGNPLVGAVPYAQLKAAIDQALAAAP
jgi:protein-disulfide isomerase